MKSERYFVFCPPLRESCSYASVEEAALNIADWAENDGLNSDDFVVVVGREIKLELVMPTEPSVKFDGEEVL